MQRRSVAARLRNSTYIYRILFSNLEPGIWLDPSDLTTMFTDRAGTTLVTTPGQTVGLRLDKSKGLVLGPELVTNGNFSGGSTGWTAGGGASLSVVSGNLRVSYSTGAAYPSANQTISGLVSGRTYEITVVANTGSGTHPVGLNCSQFNPTINVQIITSTTTSTYKTRVVATGTTSTTQIFANTGSATSSGFITVVSFSVKELAGNHATAPTDAARSTYGIEPKTGRRNLLTRTEEFGDAAWVKLVQGTGVTPVLTSGFSDPDGGNSAWRVQLNAGTNGASDYSVLRQASGLWPDTGNRSIWLKSNTGSNQTVALVATNSGSRATVTSTWQRFSQNSGSTDKQLDISVGGTGATGATADILIWHPQFEAGSTVTNYQRVGTAFDVTEAGVATVHYVQYDGTDDSFSTSSINFSATDKMSVFAGVRKLSDAAQGIVVELSAAASTNNGTFNLQAPSDAGFARYRFISKGTVSSGNFVSGYAAPISNVLTGLGDISGDTATLRINGIQVAKSTTDQGTGNYGNYPLFIGRRNNASTSFNGRDYGIIVVGKTASASEIAATESWLAAKTSGVTI